MLDHDLTDAEKNTIAVLLREAIAADPISASDRVRCMKAILDKIDPELAEPEPFRR